MNGIFFFFVQMKIFGAAKRKNKKILPKKKKQI